MQRAAAPRDPLPRRRRPDARRGRRGTRPCGAHCRLGRRLCAESGGVCGRPRRRRRGRRPDRRRRRRTPRARGARGAWCRARRSFIDPVAPPERPRVRRGDSRDRGADASYAPEDLPALEADAVLVSGYLPTATAEAALARARAPWVALDAGRLAALPAAAPVVLANEEAARRLDGRRARDGRTTARRGTPARLRHPRRRRGGRGLRGTPRTRGAASPGRR